MPTGAMSAGEASPSPGGDASMAKPSRRLELADRLNTHCCCKASFELCPPSTRPRRVRHYNKLAQGRPRSVRAGLRPSSALLRALVAEGNTERAGKQRAACVGGGSHANRSLRRCCTAAAGAGPCHGVAAQQHNARRVSGTSRETKTGSRSAAAAGRWPPGSGLAGGCRQRCFTPP
mgnify:CR=1 FL=1